jgi:hypothetical protein
VLGLEVGGVRRVDLGGGKADKPGQADTIISTEHDSDDSKVTV